MTLRHYYKGHYFIMDNCFIDLTLEFLAVAFHNILYHACVYPKSIFEARKKYSVVVYHSAHPEVNQYIELCLKSVGEFLKNGQLNRVELTVTDSKYAAVMKFIFDFDRNDQFDETTDAYLVQCEQNLRAFCLNLSALSDKFANLPEDHSFSIFIHTNESSAVSAANNPELEDFPFVEVHGSMDEMERIIPLRTFSIRNYNLNTFIEIT